MKLNRGRRIFAGSVYTFRNIIPLLERDYHVFALDLPGFGLSDKPSDYDYSYQNQGDRVGQFIKQLKLKDVTLVGHSMGGNIVLNTALNYDEVKNLIFLDPGIIEDGNPEFLKYLFFPLTRISAKLFRNPDFRRTSFESSYYHPQDITEEDMDENMIASQTDNFINSMVVMLKDYEDPQEWELVSKIEQPVLLLWGQFDRGNPPENGVLLHEAIPHSEYNLIKDSGHYIHEEKPYETYSFIHAFILKNM